MKTLLLSILLATISINTYSYDSCDDLNKAKEAYFFSDDSTEEIRHNSLKVLNLVRGYTHGMILEKRRHDTDLNDALTAQGNKVWDTLNNQISLYCKTRPTDALYEAVDHVSAVFKYSK